MDKTYKTFRGEIKEVDKEKYTVAVLVSDRSIDRDKEVILPEAWNKHLKYYKNHPVLLSSHRRDDLQRQIGESLKSQVIEPGLLCSFKYYVNEGNSEADWGFKLAEKGMAAYSVGFIPHKIAYRDDREAGPRAADIPWPEIEAKLRQYLSASEVQQVQRVFVEAELLEVSQVLVPANRNAIQQAVETGDQTVIELVEEIEKEFGKFEDEEEKGVIPYKQYLKAPEDYVWDAGEEVREADVEKLKKICVWFAGDGEKKGDYKGPHHRTSDICVVWRGVAALGGVIMGARGGMNVPDADMAGIKAHCGKHYKEFDKTPPWATEEGMAFFETEDEAVRNGNIRKLIADGLLYEEDFEELSIEVDKPFPSEHSCRLRDPKGFQPNSFRRIKRDHEGKEYSVIMGRLQNETTMTEQAYRYNRDIWTAPNAGKHCKDHKGTFEPAEPKDMQGILIDIQTDIQTRETAEKIKEIAKMLTLSNEKIEKMNTILTNVFGGSTDEKEGRVISTANMNKIKAAVQMLEEVISSAKPIEEGQTQDVERAFLDKLLEEVEAMNQATLSNQGRDQEEDLELVNFVNDLQTEIIGGK